MTKRITSILRLFPAIALCMLSLAVAAQGAATITIVNIDGPGEGFNDPTPATPVGGNPGKTIGEQRLIAFQFAADIWGAALDSNVEIRIRASFDPLSCTPTSGTLGAAGAIEIFANFPNAAFLNTWYPVALANKLAGTDLSPTREDIRAFFNSRIGTDPNCLTGTNWYYGLKNKHGNDIDLVAVLLHEFGHGLGFASFVDESNGTQIRNLTDIFSRQLLDTDVNLTWDQMSNRQRKASAINSRDVVWTGGNATAAVPTVLDFGVPVLRVNSPASIAGNYDAGSASFGPALTGAGITGDVVQALDAANTAGPSTTDACSPLTNAPAVSSKIALVDRGSCLFTVKVKNAQDAGAIGVIVADNVQQSPPPDLAGSDTTINIPAIRITLADGNTVKSQLGVGVNATMKLDLSQRAGADSQGRAQVWTPDPGQPGSSVSHWDVVARPNQLMEPFISDDLTHSVEVPEDLTFELLQDLGW